ncbi:cathepsin L, putative [Acanthamoeba castellanii str. Neff]|uniref:Cathepsin L, putative n=1 Tax=Acanthamoeba castellanii (strain ATCC 30010 / Neff) TaxID=1257118 RepID=L8H5N3_ACACF|nr:cathepsin L, putative [Acanthamoeba castellanii str. Neff]ELR20475.1 cathepsin L, putative [Acanthamoeba castellanii str. Neff]
MRPATLLALSAVALFVFFVASASSDQKEHDTPLRHQFTDWVVAHNKTYVNPELAHRWNVWRENYRFIEEHNRQNHSYSLGMNQFGDLTFDDYKALYTVTMPPFNASDFDDVYATPTEANATEAAANSSGLARRHPVSLDWRIWGAVQAVKNQGSCGSCYAFSAIGALETAHWRKHNTLPDLSEQHIVDCTREYGNGGCSGGWMHTAFKWLQEKGGAVSQADYPYTNRVGTCQHASKPKATYLAKYVRIGAGNEQQLLDAVATVGTVSVAINAGTQQFSYYSGGILDVANCGNRPTHAVLLVGYGTENGKDFWILKNSWGTSWGEKGFFRLARGKNMCGIADWASYPIV